LDEGGEFADSSSLLAENFLCVGSSNDDVGDGGCDTNFNTGVSFLSKFALEELVQFGIENTIRNESVSVSFLFSFFFFLPTERVITDFLRFEIAVPGTPDAILKFFCREIEPAGEGSISLSSF